MDRVMDGRMGLVERPESNLKSKPDLWMNSGLIDIPRMYVFSDMYVCTHAHMHIRKRPSRRFAWERGGESSVPGTSEGKANIAIRPRMPSDGAPCSHARALANMQRRSTSRLVRSKRLTTSHSARNLAALDYDPHRRQRT